MSRKNHLERSIRESHAIIREYEETIQTSNRPDERLRAERQIDRQWGLIEGYLKEYTPLVGGDLPPDIAEIAEYFKPTSAVTSREEPTASAKYEIHIGHASGVAIGDGAQIVQQTDERTTQRPDVVWNRSALRELLTAAFTDGELTALCYDRFPQVYDKLGEEMGKSAKVHRLLEHCISHDKVEMLLGLVCERNPAQYERFRGGRLPGVEVQEETSKPPQSQPEQPILSEGEPVPVEEPPTPVPTFLWRWVAGIMVVVLLAWGLYGVLGGVGQPTATLRPPTSTPRPPTSTPIAVITRVREKDGAVMVYVPAGEFWMGSGAGYPFVPDEETPGHKVYVNAFWIDRTEVTNAQYKKCVDAGACSPPSSSKSRARESYYGNPEYGDYPVIHVTWHQAREYAEWVGGRLPTEAEWEYAACGPDGNRYPWGDNLPNMALYNCSHAVGDTAAVGSCPDGASWCGALDMAGNVWEWTQSLYRDYPYDPTDGREDLDAEGYRVMRGGSFLDDSDLLRCTVRGPGLGVGDRPLGFRVVVVSLG